MSRRQKNKNILPEGFFTKYKEEQENQMWTLVKINQGPWKNLCIWIQNKVKIRDDENGNPKLLFDFRIGSEEGYVANPNNTEKSLERIVAAIVCDIYNDELDNGAGIDSELQKNGTKHRIINTKELDL